MIELYARSRKPGAYLIRMSTFWSDWSHVAVLDRATNTVLESTFPRGVIATPFEEWKKHYTKWVAKETYTSVLEEHEVISFMRRQLGKGYDVTGILAIPFNKRDWQEETDWSCAELVEAAKHSAGIGSYSPEYTWRVSPEMLWQLEPRKAPSQLERKYMTEEVKPVIAEATPIVLSEPDQPPKPPEGGGPTDDGSVSGGNGPRPK